MAGNRANRDDGRLDSWKEIAAHLGVSVRTAQRWEKNEGLPIRRLLHDKLGSAYAFTGEVDEWREKRSVSPPARVETAVSNTTRRSLAVLPFTALNRDEESNVLADGLTDELITALSQFTDLRVIARASSFFFKGREFNVRRIASQLRVDTILTGSVRRSDSTLRVNAQLIDAAQGHHLWARRFESEVSETFELEDELTKAVTEALRVRPNGSAIARHRSFDERVYNLVLKARFFWNQRDREGLEKALVLYREALELEPRFAPAFAGIAECHGFLWAHASYEWSPTVAAAEEAALEALRIDSKSNNSHRSLAIVRIAQNDLTGARDAFHRALGLNPTDARARHWLAMVDAALGNLDEAMEGIAAALEADPLSMAANQDYGRILFLSGQHEKAKVQLKHTLEIAPRLRWARIYLAFAYIQLGVYDDALNALDALDDRAPLSAFVRGQAGDEEAARQLLHASTSNDLKSTWAGLLHLGMGENDAAMTRFLMAKRHHELEFLEMCAKVQPLFTPLRSHPQFEELLPR